MYNVTVPRTRAVLWSRVASSLRRLQAPRFPPRSSLRVRSTVRWSSPRVASAPRTWQTSSSSHRVDAPHQSPASPIARRRELGCATRSAQPWFTRHQSYRRKPRHNRSRNRQPSRVQSLPLRMHRPLHQRWKAHGGRSWNRMQRRTVLLLVATSMAVTRSSLEAAKVLSPSCSVLACPSGLAHEVSHEPCWVTNRTAGDMMISTRGDRITYSTVTYSTLVVERN